MKRLTWNEGDLVSLKLRDDLYTIGQALISPCMRFYDISNKDGIWKDVDLNEVKSLFRVFVLSASVKDLVVEKIKERSVKASTMSFESIWIKPHLNFDGGFAFRGGKLVDTGPGGLIEPTEAPIIKQNLRVSDDRELMENYELTNMWGSGPLSDRLCRYFDTGINRDDLKFEVFPGLWDDREKLRPLTRRLPVPFR